MNLKLLQTDENHIRRLAAEAYPHECCGFLIGEEKDSLRQIDSVVPALNQNSTSPHNRFLITPEALKTMEQKLDGIRSLLLGFFHSHPDSPARPSTFDLDHAWPWYSYIIVSASQTQTGDLKSWRLQDDGSRFQEELVVVE